MNRSCQMQSRYRTGGLELRSQAVFTSAKIIRRTRRPHSGFAVSLLAVVPLEASWLDHISFASGESSATLALSSWKAPLTTRWTRRTPPRAVPTAKWNFRRISPCSERWGNRRNLFDGVNRGRRTGRRWTGPPTWGAMSGTCNLRFGQPSRGGCQSRRCFPSPAPLQKYPATRLPAPEERWYWRGVAALKHTGLETLTDAAESRRLPARPGRVSSTGKPMTAKGISAWSDDLDRWVTTGQEQCQPSSQTMARRSNLTRCGAVRPASRRFAMQQENTTVDPGLGGQRELQDWAVAGSPRDCAEIINRCQEEEAALDYIGLASLIPQWTISPLG